MSWDERAAANLLPLSHERDSLKVALTEWVYEGTVEDLEEAVETCQLCEHPNIRYRFQIVNDLTGNTLEIGSECIKRFSIAALDENGRLLRGSAARTKVDADRRQVIKRAQVRSVINSLVVLASFDQEFKFEAFIEYYQRREAFTPNQMLLLQWQFDKYEVRHTPSHFKVSMKRGRERDQLFELEGWKVGKLLPYLTTSQKKWCEDHLVK